MSWSQTTSAAAAASGLPTGFMSAQYGNGGMGDLLVLTGTTATLTKDSYYSSVTIQGTGVLKPSGYKLLCSGTLTVSSSGAIHDDGVAGVGTSGGTGLPGGSTTIRGTCGSGSAGVSTVSAGVASSGLSNQAFNAAGVLPTGGAGGTSGAQAGGIGGVGSSGGYAVAANWASGRMASGTVFTGGGGGGSGGNSSGAGTSAGAGGGGGGVVWIAAKTIVNSGRISANGGAGGNAAGAGNASGGGGGAGGIVWIITDTATSTLGTITANGGGVGTPVGTGGAAVAGSAGITCIIGMSGT